MATFVRGGFARLAAAELVSPLGTAMGTLALILHIQRTRGTGTAVGVLLVVETAGPLLGPLLGAIADRIDVKRALVISQVGQAVAVAGMLFALHSTIGLLALVFVRGLLAAVLPGATGAAVSALVADEDLTRANAFIGTARELGSIIGPPIAGVLFALRGARPVLIVDVVTFVVAAAFLAGLPTLRATAEAEHEAADPPTDHPNPVLAWESHALAADSHVKTGGMKGEAHEVGLFAATREGLSFIRHHRLVLAITLGFWLLVFGSAGDDLLLPFLATNDLHAGPRAVGIMAAAASLGVVGGLMVISRWGRRLPPLGSIAVGMAMVSAGNLLTAAAPVLAIAVATQMLRGSGIAVFEPNLRTVLQREVPRQLMGRVFATVYGGVGVAAGAGYAIAGPLLDATSPRAMFVIIGVAGLAASAATSLLMQRAARAPSR